VQFDRFPDELLNLLARIADGDNARQIGNVGAPGFRALFVNDRVPHLSLSFNSRPALRSIALSVPNGMSLPGWPGTVTTAPISG